MARAGRRGAEGARGEALRRAPRDGGRAQQRTHEAAMDDGEPFVDEFEKTYTVNGIEGCRLLGYSDDVRIYEDNDGTRSSLKAQRSTIPTKS